MATISTDQNYPNVVLTITDEKGRPAKVDGVPVWASSDETQITVTPAADGMSAVVDTVAPSSPGATARITVTADADLGAGVQTLTGVSEDITVTQGTSHVATVMALSLGDPADKPDGSAPVASALSAHTSALSGPGLAPTAPLTK
jgi:hypothetical protein